MMRKMIDDVELETTRQHVALAAEAGEREDDFFFPRNRPAMDQHVFAPPLLMNRGKKKIIGPQPESDPWNKTRQCG